MSQGLTPESTENNIFAHVNRKSASVQGPNLPNRHVRVYHTVLSKIHTCRSDVNYRRVRSEMAVQVR